MVGPRARGAERPGSRRPAVFSGSSMPQYLTEQDLTRLRQLRATLVGIEARPPGTAAPRYWRDERDLALYDASFGARIAWKWRAVLSELSQRGFSAPADGVVDFGCGTGVASREWLSSPLGSPGSVLLWDRDPMARRFAREAVEVEHPGSRAVELSSPAHEGDVAGRALLISHVLDELDGADLTRLLEVARAAEAVVWVEPGSRLTSRRLSEARDELLDTFHVAAPCTHSARCGALRGDAQRTWCHLFAVAPQEVYTEGRWAELGRELGIDLRSLPYSFVALQRAPVAGTDAARVLGRPRLQRGRALVDTCEADGLREDLVLQRLDKALFKALEREVPRRLRVTREGGKVVQVRDLDSERRSQVGEQGDPVDDLA